MTYQFINPEYIEMVSGGDRETVIELVSIFRDQVLEIANEMKSLNARNELHSLGLLAHKAKSSVAIMGMNDLALMLKTFELEGKEGKNRANYGEYIERYEADTAKALLELDDYLNNM